MGGSTARSDAWSLQGLWAFGLTGTDDDDDDDGDGVGSGSGQLARPNGSPVLGRKQLYTKRNTTCP